MKYKFLLLVVVVTLAPLAGCVPSKSVVEINFHGEFNTSTDGIQIDGTLVARGGISEVDKFQSVAVTLYDSNGEQLSTHPIGNLQEYDGRLNISVRSPVEPKYVVFESPDFWYENVRVEYYVNRAGEFKCEHTKTRSGLPIS